MGTEHPAADASRVPPAAPRLELVFLAPSERPPLPLTGSSYVLGRDVSCDVELPDPSVSRRHARLEGAGDTFRVRDLGSTNGVLVNGEPVEEAAVGSGDRIKLGVFELTLRRAEATGVAEDLPVHATLVRRLEDFSADWGVRPPGGGAPAEKRRILDQAYGNEIFGVLLRLAGELLRAEAEETVLERVMEVTAEALPGERGFVFLAGDDGTLTCAVSRIEGRVTHRPDMELPVSHTILRTVMERQMALVTPDALADDRLAEGKSILMHQIRSAMCSPLWSGERILGVLQLDAPFRPNLFTEQDLELLTAIANYAAVALERIRWAREAERELRARERLARYHSPAVLEEVLRRGEAEPEGRRLESTHLSVLFADVVGFTAFAEAADPEAVVELLARFFDRAVEAIFEEGGTLDKFIGDCVMAFFGAPVAQGDHARRAVAAAVEIQRRVASLNAELAAGSAPALDIRVAVNSGPVMVGDIGSERRVDYTVLGNTVNVAARLEAFVASPGQVVIGPETRRLVGETVPVESLGEQRLKGLERPIEAFRVLA